MPWPDNGRGRGTSTDPGLDTQQITATNGNGKSIPDGSDRHCADCRCRCRCHRPPPEPPYTKFPLLPGEPFYMAAIAAGEVEPGELAA